MDALSVNNIRKRLIVERAVSLYSRHIHDEKEWRTYAISMLVSDSGSINPTHCQERYCGISSSEV